MHVTFNKNNIPSDLRKNDNWVNQELTWNQSKNKFDKKPQHSGSGTPVKWSNPETWSSIHEAETRFRKNPNAVPAYIMTEVDNLICIDLDHCCDSDGNPLPYAQHLIDLFQSYTERSVSGDGVHIFVNGKIDLKGDVTIIHEGEEHQVEIFAAGKIITLTGDLINDDYADIEDGDMELEKLEAMVKPKAKMTVTVGQGNQTGSLTSEQELKKLDSALKTLSSSSYGDWLDCGMALRLYGSQNDCEAEVWELFNRWSSTTETNNYDYQRNHEAWSSWDTAETSQKQVTIGSIYHKAREAGWTFDNRTITAAGNGKKGGRPSLPLHGDTAREYFGDELIESVSGFPVLRCYDGHWFEWSREGWVRISKQRVESDISTYIQNRPDLEKCCTSNYYQSTVKNIASYNHCGTKCQMPSMLDTGENADHWLAFSDGWMVNMLELARIKAGQVIGGTEAEYKRRVSPAFFSKSYVEYPLESEGRSMPMFRKYLDQVQPDPCNQRMIQQMMGLMLCDETRYESAFALVGSGANGKTVLLDILAAMVGRVNVSSVDLHRINERFQNFPLAESKVNICGEMPTDIGVSNLHKVEGVLKNCISGGLIEIEMKNLDKQLEQCRARFIFATNTMPTFVDKSDGIWRRLKVIEFPVTVPKAERDVHLADKIIAVEMPGILLWALEGLVEIVRDGFIYESPASAELKQQHRLNCDREKSFLLEACSAEDDYVSKDMLYRTYTNWCGYNGRANPLSKVNFLKRVKEIYPHVEECQRAIMGGIKRVRCLSGIELLDNSAWRDPEPLKEPENESAGG